MRTLRRSFLLGLIAGVGLGPSAVAADERAVFLYRNGEQQGALIHDYANCWAEFVNSVDRYRFVEIARSSDTIELLDVGRDIGLKVHDRRVELRLQGTTIWQPWGEGRWVGMAELPRSVRFTPTDWKVRLAYFVPTDRSPLPDYTRRIRVVMDLINDIFLADLKAKGYRSGGFRIETDSRGEPVVHLIRGSRPSTYYNNAPEFNTTSEHFDRIAEEVPGLLGSPARHLILLFPETYDLGPAPVEWRGSVGVGSHISTDGGLAIMSAWILRDEFCAGNLEEQKKYLRDTTPIRGRTSFGTGRANSPRFEFIEDGFGAAAHELGHALGLPHDGRSPNNLMGQGFRRLQMNYPAVPARTRPLAFSVDNARLLGVSRYLVPEVDRTDNLPPKAEIRLERVSGPPAATVVRMRASDDRALRAVVFFDPEQDTVLGGAELKGRSQSLEYTLPRRIPGAAGSRGGTRFRLLTLLADGGGNIARIETSAPSR